MKRPLHSEAMFILPATIGHGATYYVDCRLSSNCDGTFYHYDVSSRARIAGAGEVAWENIQEANLTVSAGDTCSVRAGTYATKNCGIVPYASGTKANRIVFTVYHNESVIISGDGAIDQCGINLTGHSKFFADRDAFEKGCCFKTHDAV